MYQFMNIPPRIVEYESIDPKDLEEAQNEETFTFVTVSNYLLNTL